MSDEVKSELIGQIYDVAIDPERLEILIDLWEKRLGGNRDQPLTDAQPGRILHDDALVRHLERASSLLDQQDGSKPQDGVARELAKLEPTAAFAANADGKILGVNEAFSAVFAITPKTPLYQLPIDEVKKEELRSYIQKALKPGDSQVRYLRAETTDTKRLVVFRISRLDLPAGHESLALVASTEMAWPARLTTTVRDAFGLTAAEADVVRGLVEGNSVQDIADKRERSLATVRTQIRSILAKTETNTQSELIRITINMMEPERNANRPVLKNSRSDTETRLAEVPFQSIFRPDGRQVDYLVLGDPNAVTSILFLPSAYNLVRWPASAERYLAEQSIRVVVPVRPGYGESTSYGDRSKLIRTVCDDMAAILDRLNIAQCPIIALADDSIFSFHFDHFHPGRLQAILGFGGGLPYFTTAHFLRMHKWHRFLYSNARFAPLLLPFMIKASFAMVRRSGTEQVLQMLHGGSPSDVVILKDPDVRKSVLSGSQITLSEHKSSHEAFANEFIAFQRPWQARVQDCKVPVVFFIGNEDPMIPPETLSEMKVEYPNVEFVDLPDCGEFLFMKYWKEVLARALTYQ